MSLHYNIGVGKFLSKNNSTVKLEQKELLMSVKYIIIMSDVDT